MFANSAKGQILVVKHPNGNTTDIELLTQPQIKFQNEKVLITSTVLSMEYPKEDILAFTFKGKTTGINHFKDNLHYTQENDRIIFHGLKSSEKVSVYNIKGIRIPANVQCVDGKVTFPVSPIPSGIYLLKINGKTFRLTKNETKNIPYFFCNFCPQVHGSVHRRGILCIS